MQIEPCNKTRGPYAVDDLRSRSPILRVFARIPFADDDDCGTTAQCHSVTSVLRVTGHNDISIPYAARRENYERGKKKKKKKSWSSRPATPLVVARADLVSDDRDVRIIISHATCFSFSSPLTRRQNAAVRARGVWKVCETVYIFVPVKETRNCACESDWRTLIIATRDNVVCGGVDERRSWFMVVSVCTTHELWTIYESYS